MAKELLKVRGATAKEHMVPEWEQTSDSGMQHPMEAFSCKVLSDGRPAHAQSPW